MFNVFDESSSTPATIDLGENAYITEAMFRSWAVNQDYVPGFKAGEGQLANAIKAVSEQLAENPLYWKEEYRDVLSLPQDGSASTDNYTEEEYLSFTVGVCHFVENRLRALSGAEPDFYTALEYHRKYTDFSKELT